MRPYGELELAPETADPTAAHRRGESVVSLARSLPPVGTLPVSIDLRRVVIRVRGGEEIEVGRTEGREPAVRIARDAIRMIDEAVEADEWPAVGDRFLRPDAIVSIDIQRTT